MRKKNLHDYIKTKETKLYTKKIVSSETAKFEYKERVQP